MHSLEIIPKQTERIKMVPPNLFGDIYVAFIPGDSIDSIITACKSILDYGYTPVPHVPARNISNEKELTNYLYKLSDVGVKKILAIGGSGTAPEGIFESTYAIFETGLINQFNFEQINIAGHPEGNPNDMNSDLNLLKKLNWLTENNIKSSIVTQWTFDITKTNGWIEKIKPEVQYISNSCEIHLGVAGPAKITTLINYARICGVSAASIIAKNKKLDLTKLLKHNPSEIIDTLIGYDNLHFFPFGGIKELVNWENNISK
jgi:methylenetetrahydrofolate reductase (NADPH)